jgi:hypothetical protein
MNPSVVKKHLALFFLFLAFLFSACTKIVTTDLGGGLIPPVDGVNTKEMYLDVASVNAVDTITRVGINFDHALGYVNDPLFGKTTASINVQLKPSFPLSWPAGNDSMFIDSAVMVLSYKNTWGDSLQPLAFRVYEVLSNVDSAQISPDSAYTTNHFIPRGNELTENFTPKTVIPSILNDSVKPNPFMEEAANQLRIRLNPVYGSKLLTLDPSVYTNDSTFNAVIKGYQIVPEQTGNALLRVNLLDTNTKLAIYFRYKDRKTSGKIDTTVNYFRANSFTSGSSNYIVRDRTGSQVASWLPHNNSNNDSLIFIDDNPGIYAKIHIPGLDSNLNNVIIHRAEILMEQIADPTNVEEKYLTPPNLFLAPYSQDSMRRFGLPNDVQYGAGFVSNQFLLGCYPYIKTDSNSGQSIYAYRFDISRYVQGIVSRHEKSYNFVLYAPFNDYIYLAETSPFTAFTGTSTTTPLNPGPAMGRVRLGGGCNVLHKMKLRIVYSDLLK